MTVKVFLGSTSISELSSRVVRSSVMTHTGRDARAYAETLVHVVSRRSEPAALKAAINAAGIDGHSPLISESIPSQSEKR